MGQNHKSMTIGSWRKHGLILSSKEEGDEIYDRYINSTHCEKCKKKYKSNLDRQMDHSHDIHKKYGYLRNILCKSCNLKRHDLYANNTSGYNGIYKQPDKTCTQGYIWQFKLIIDGKMKSIKQSVDLPTLIKFAENWKKEN